MASSAGAGASHRSSVCRQRSLLEPSRLKSLRNKRSSFRITITFFFIVFFLIVSFFILVFFFVFRRFTKHGVSYSVINRNC